MNELEWPDTLGGEVETARPRPVPARPAETPVKRWFELSRFPRGECMVIGVRVFRFGFAYELTREMFGDLLLAPFRLGCVLIVVAVLAVAVGILGFFLSLMTG